MPVDYRKARASVLAGSSAAGIGAGATVNFYIGSGGPRLCIVPRNGVLRFLGAWANGAPGAGQTYTYTVMVNGVASALTCQTAGAVDQASSDLTHQVAITAGDRVSFQCVNSAGGAVQDHSCSVEYAF